MPNSSYFHRGFETQSFFSPADKADIPAEPFDAQPGFIQFILQAIKESGLGRFFVDTPPVCRGDIQSRQQAETDQAKALYKAMLDITSH